MDDANDDPAYATMMSSPRAKRMRLTGDDVVRPIAPVGDIANSRSDADDDESCEHSDIPDESTSESDDSDGPANSRRRSSDAHAFALAERADNALEQMRREREALERVLGRRLRIVVDDADATDDELLARVHQRAQSFDPAAPLHPMTSEQRQIVLHRPQEGERVLANAFAGAAKTTLCRLLACRFSGHWRPLYIVFNKEAERAAKRSMPDHVECRTTHSTALAFVREHTGWEGQGELEAVPVIRDQAVARTLQAFFNDASRADVDPVRHVSESDARLRNRHEVAELARSEWQSMCTDKDARWTYDAVLKYMVVQQDASHEWLSERYDVVFVDEAQDTQRVLMPWYDALTSVPVYFVGDTHQSIYGFNGSRDAMQHVARHPSTRRFALTQSFRFGDNLAALATRLLRRMFMLAGDVRIRGCDDRQTRIVYGGVPDDDQRTPIMYVARTNAGAIAKAFAAHHAGLSVRLLGRAGETLRKSTGIVNAHESVLPGGGNRFSTVNQRLDVLSQRYRCSMGRARPRTFSDRMPFSESDRRERGVLRILQQYGTEQMRALSASLNEMDGDSDDVDDDDDDALNGDASELQSRERSAPVADVTLGTVHSTKGLEFERVALLDDFYPLKLLRRGLDLFARRMEQLGSYDLTPDDERCIWSVIEGSMTRDDRFRLRALVRPPEDDSGLTLPQQLDEEVHLYYVAMTRARSVLYLNNELSQFLKPRRDRTAPASK